MIEVKDLGKCYKDSSGEIWPVKGMDFTIEDGTFVSIVGRSGSGKSTLLKMMGGLLKPTKGCVQIDGTDLYSLNEREMAHYRCNKIGFIFQDYFLEEMYTVYQNVEIVLMISKTEAKLRKEMIEQGETDATKVKNTICEKINTEPLAKIDYVEIVDFNSIEPVETIESSILTAIAVYIGKTRLIDNFIIEK